ncbi:MAG: hypothetical protein R6W84_18420 [Promethearchaeia archaeon]
MERKKLLKISVICSLFIFLAVIGINLYYANKPLLETSKLTDTFDDQLPGLYPLGWFSGITVHPENIQIVQKDGSNVMKIQDTLGVTEVMKKFKKTTEGTIICDINIDSSESGFVIHIPQKDSEYNPHDDIIIVFLNGGIYIITEENLVEVEDQGETIWLIDEWSLETTSTPVGTYRRNIWFTIQIDFTMNNFIVFMDQEKLGTFNYPSYTPSYLCSLYFWTLYEPTGFNVYIDNVDITLIETYDSIHPLNAFLLGSVSLSIALILYFLYDLKILRFKKDEKMLYFLIIIIGIAFFVFILGYLLEPIKEGFFHLL